MRAARLVLDRRYPGQYAHRLRDINNNSAIPDESFLDAIDAALASVASELSARLDLAGTWPRS
jgi:hypothetical protein